MVIKIYNLVSAIHGTAALGALSLSWVSIANDAPIHPVNTTKWFQQTQLPNGDAWFNNEQQHYTNRITNAFVSDGTLKIVAKKEPFADQGKTNAGNELDAGQNLGARSPALNWPA